MNKNPLDAMDRFVALLDAPEPSFPRLVEHRRRRRRRRQVAAGAGATTTIAGFVAAMVWVLPIGTDPSRDVTSVASATEHEAAAAPATTEPLGPEAVPVEFTACAEGDPPSSGGQTVTLAIPMSGGEMTVNRTRGDIHPQIMSGVSDPRLDGTWQWSWNEDDYVGPQGQMSASIVTMVWRMENDEGAWQGSQTNARFPEGIGWSGAETNLVLTGEGAYEGLTAVMSEFNEECPNMRGYIVSLGVPEAEATFPPADDQPTTTSDP